MSLPPDMPREWPVPSGAYDPATGADAARGMEERVRFVERLGFDWISLSEHHYSPRILTPSPAVSAAWLAARVDSIKIALLGPIVPTSNPIRVAEEFAMLDALAPGRIVFGMLRGTTNEYLSYDLNPARSARAHRRRHGADPEGLDRAAAVRLAGAVFPVSHRIAVAAPAATAGADLCAGHQRAKPERSPRGIIWASACRTGNSKSMGRSTGYYRQQCAQYGWTPGPDDII